MSVGSINVIVSYRHVNVEKNKPEGTNVSDVTFGVERWKKYGLTSVSLSD